MPSLPPLSELPEHYRVWRRDDGSWWQLGRGAVYKATDRRTDETVALRFFEAGSRHPDAMGALAEYAARLARPGSPLVARLRDFFISGDFNVAATEFIAGETLAERVRREGPLRAGPAWTVARLLLEALESLHALGIAHGSLGPSKILLPGDGGTDPPLKVVAAGLHPSANLTADPSVGSDATREDLRCLGTTLWFALTGDELETTPGAPPPWQRLDAAGITPAWGALPVLLARTLTGEPAQRPRTVPALRAALNLLAPFSPSAATSWDVPNRAPTSQPTAPPPKSRPLLFESGEMLTGEAPHVATPNRRRKKPRWPWILLFLLVLGEGAFVLTGVVSQPAVERQGKTATAAPPQTLPARPGFAPKPAPLPPSPPVSDAGIAARLDRLQRLQPEAGDVLKYAREWRRVATLPVSDATVFPEEAQVAQLLERFDWRGPASPYLHRTALLLVLGYANGQSDAQSGAASQQDADELSQALAQHGVISPIDAAGMGSPDGMREVETAGDAGGQFVEVWVAFTLF